jgi:hypothetical protein
MAAYRSEFFTGVFAAEEKEQGTMAPALRGREVFFHIIGKQGKLVSGLPLPEALGVLFDKGFAGNEELRADQFKIRSGQKAGQNTPGSAFCYGVGGYQDIR